MNRKRIMILIGSALFLCLSGMFCYMIETQTKKEETWISTENVVTMDNGNASNVDEIESSNEKETKESIKVYICGAVNTPGVYELSSGERLVDLLDLCGGFLEEADSTCVNLAQYLEDGEKIYIMTKEEQKTAIDQKEEESDCRININTATLEELMTLPGIGKAKAERIITYREQTTHFASIDEIMKIDGIKDCVYKKIKDFIKI